MISVSAITLRPVVQCYYVKRNGRDCVMFCVIGLSVVNNIPYTTVTCSLTFYCNSINNICMVTLSE